MALKIKSDQKTGPVDYSSHLEEKQLVTKPIISTTTKSHKVAPEGWKEEPLKSEVVHPGVFVSKNTGCTVALEGGVTINLGNMEFARIGITLTIPCDPEAINEAYEYGTDWISQKLKKAVDEAKGN